MAARLASIIIPAFNEGFGLADNLRRLLLFLDSAGDAFDYEIIVIDDGSGDATYEFALNAASYDKRLRVVRHAKNMGLGCAIRTGFAFAQGDAAVVYDSDLSYDPKVISRLLERLQAHGDDLVLASPYMRGGCVRNVPWLRRFMSREGNRFLSFATNGRLATLTCMVRAYRPAFFRSLQTSERRMEINPEAVFKALEKGARVSEIPAELVWTAQRAAARGTINVGRTIVQSLRTMGYGIRYRPAVLLALPGLAPGLLPLTVAVAALLHCDLKTIAEVTLATTIVQYSSLALFAGQLAVFGRNVSR